jgi:hypothetical protein
MKAAPESRGADTISSTSARAKKSDDPKVVAATMAKPAVVLKRPVGRIDRSEEHADLPTDLGRGGEPAEAGRKRRRPESPRPVPAVLTDKAAERKAALAYERKEKRRKREPAKEEATARKDERRQRAVDRAHSAFDAAKREHIERASAIEAEREAVGPTTPAGTGASAAARCAAARAGLRRLSSGGPIG